MHLIALGLNRSESVRSIDFDLDSDSNKTTVESIPLTCIQITFTKTILVMQLRSLLRLDGIFDYITCG